MAVPDTSKGGRRLPLWIILVGCIALCLCSGVLHAAAAPYSEDAVKAIFLYRFAAYVNWPPADRATRYFSIAVIGDEGVADELSEFLPAHRVGDQPAQVRRINNSGEVGDAQIVYIGAGYQGDIRAFVQSLAYRPVLVVTDSQQGLATGSTVNFVIIDQHVRFEISLSAAARAGLKISAQLLAVASHVATGWLWPASSCPVLLAAHPTDSCAVVADR